LITVISRSIQLFKTACKFLLLKLGYEIRSTYQPPVEDVDFLAAKNVKESEFYSQWVGPCPLFSPWLGHPEFKAAYQGAEPYTLVSPDRCYMLISLARYASYLTGDFAECGVWKGGTALILARILSGERDKKLYLFDSFKGLPKVDQERDPWFHEGQYSAESVEVVEKVLHDFRDRVELHCGWIPESFKGLEESLYAFVHIDVDIYQSNWDCCEYFYPRMVDGGVMLFDEYAFAAARGEKEAVDRFFADKSESPMTLPTGQAVVLKLPASRLNAGSERNRRQIAKLGLTLSLHQFCNLSAVQLLSL
jgi:O-methyltransferase